ncbi:MAG: acetyl-CoA carboxylase biotin carboxyl carrier protein [Spirochaetia bacterium]
MELKDILKLMDKFDESSLTRFKYEQGDEKITFSKKGDPIISQAGTAAAPPAPVPVPAQGNLPAESQSAPPVQTETTAKGAVTIDAPIVGTYYSSPSPDSPAFVQEGQRVKAGENLCIIEAMKVMNELQAEFDCKIDKILVENGTMVEYGTPLFEVTRL